MDEDWFDDEDGLIGRPIGRARRKPKKSTVTDSNNAVEIVRAEKAAIKDLEKSVKRLPILEKKLEAAISTLQSVNVKIIDIEIALTDSIRDMETETVDDVFRIGKTLTKVSSMKKEIEKMVADAVKAKG